MSTIAEVPVDELRLLIQKLVGRMHVAPREAVRRMNDGEWIAVQAEEIPLPATSSEPPVKRPEPPVRKEDLPLSNAAIG